MGLLDTLQQVINSASAPSAQQIDAVTREAPKDQLGNGVAEAFRSKETPPFAEMVGGLFEKATPEQRTAMLNAIVEKLGPGALAGVAGGALAGHEGAATPSIPLDKASQISTRDVRDVVNVAETGEPGIMDRMGQFYAEHPELVKTLGAGALMIALAKIKSNLGR